VTSGATSAGDVVTIAYLLTIVSFPIRAIGWLLGEFPRSVVGYRRAKAVLDAEGNMPYGEDELPRRTGGGALLEVDGLHYSYDPDAPLLRGVDFDVQPGQTVAIVGATASGKSTLTSLLTRLVDPDAGQVRIDGHDVKGLRRGELPRDVALVPQTAFMFDDTVRDNVTLGADVPDEQVWAALRTAQADGFVAALSDGLDTQLGERGTSLSGGQRQRLSLARALVRRPRLLILDDATSAVDPEVEARILASLRDERNDGGHGAATSLVVVAYRKATISLADEVVHLDEGRIVGRGTHADLLVSSPAYAHLVNAYEVDVDAEETAR
jgi:ABC-type multidrug transport system fused ATPase/permease subunit